MLGLWGENCQNMTQKQVLSRSTGGMLPEAPCSVIALYRYIGIHIDLPLHCPPS